ncbi:uncharacterized protein PSFLO_04946 [Pseudozyma flocculosa]|uniref:Uncharacterized protein n=1 Tax=Pseudozyma flocculosa TaxID=84751 RepID=A0A5C3F6U3_9BASI|nr:uncharacterized protein PSFLO_04946 [Pseudozyma flocculosa]
MAAHMQQKSAATAPAPDGLGRPPSYSTSQARDRFIVTNPDFDSIAEQEGGDRGARAHSPDRSDQAPKGVQMLANGTAESPKPAEETAQPRGQGGDRLESPPLTLRGSSPSDRTDSSLLQLLTEKSTTGEASSAAPSAALVPCLFGFPMPLGSRVMELSDNLPASVESVRNQDSTAMSAEPSDSSGNVPTSIQPTVQPDSIDSGRDQVDATVTPLAALNAWRLSIRETADFAHAAAERISSVKKDLAQQPAASSSTEQAPATNGQALHINAHAEPNNGDGEVRRQAPASKDGQAAQDATPAVSQIFDAVTAARQPVATPSPESDALASSRETIEGLIGEYFAPQNLTDADVPPLIVEPRSPTSPTPAERGAAPDGSSDMRRRGTFGQLDGIPVARAGAEQHASNGSRVDKTKSAGPLSTSPTQAVGGNGAIFNRHLSPSSLSSAHSASPTGDRGQSPDQKRRLPSSTAVSPFSMSMHSSTSDETEFLSDDLFRDPSSVHEDQAYVLASDKALEVPAKVVKQLLRATVGNTQASVKSTADNEPLRMLHRELAKILAYLYFIEDSKLLAWTTKTVYQRQNAPAKQWAQLCNTLKEFQPLKPPQSNFSTYLAAPTRIAILRHLGFPDHVPVASSSTSASSDPAPNTPPASPWHKPLHIFSRKPHGEHHQSRDSFVPPRLPGHYQLHDEAQSFAEPSAPQEEGAISGMGAQEAADFIAAHLKRRAVDCLSLDVLIAISNLCVHRVFAPVLLRRLLAFFALGDTENGFVPVEAEVKLLRDYREFYLRPQSALLRARIKEFNVELEVEAMLRTFEAASDKGARPSSAESNPQQALAASEAKERPAMTAGTTEPSHDEWGSERQETTAQGTAMLSSSSSATTPLWPHGGVDQAPPASRPGDEKQAPYISRNETISVSGGLGKRLLSRMGHARSRSTSTGTGTTKTISSGTFRRKKKHAADPFDGAHIDASSSSTTSGADKSKHRLRRKPTSIDSLEEPRHQEPVPPLPSAGASKTSVASSVNMVAAIDELVKIRQQAVSARAA